MAKGGYYTTSQQLPTTKKYSSFLLYYRREIMIIKGIIILTRFDRTDAYVSKSATSSCERLREESAFTIS